MNLVSALCVALAAGLTVPLARRLTDALPIAVAAALGLALTPIVWSIGTHADVHALHLAFVALLLVLLVEWERRTAAVERAAGRWLVAAAGAFGVAAANHSLTLLLAPGVGLYVLAVDRSILRRPRLVAGCLVALVGAVGLLYAELPLRAGPFRAPLVYGQPDTWEGFRYIVLAEQFRGSLVDPLGDLSGKLRSLADLSASQFGILAPLVPVGFLATAVRAPRYALLTGISALVTVFFAASYVNADISRYYLGPALMAWTWLAILTAAAAERLGPLARLVDAATGSSRVAVPGLLALALIAPSLAAAPATAGDVDLGDDRAAARWLDAALHAMEPDAVVVSWWSFSTPLWYAQLIEGRFADRIIVDDRTRLDLGLGEVPDVIDRYLGRRPVYVIRASGAAIASLRARYELTAVPEAAQLYRVVAPVGATP
jgi:hypothetical protein